MADLTGAKSISYPESAVLRLFGQQLVVRRTSAGQPLAKDHEDSGRDIGAEFQSLLFAFLVSVN